jgi:hypothetical protein
MTLPTANDETVWPPYCGEEYGRDPETGENKLAGMAGPPVVCDKLCHDEKEKHFSSEYSFEW